MRVGKRVTIHPFVVTGATHSWPDNKGKVGTLYVIESAGFYKVGVAQNFVARFSSLNSATPLPMRKIALRTVPLTGMVFAEKWVHARFAEKRVKGEWFAITEKEALDALPEAVRIAKIYTDCCRDWWNDRLLVPPVPAPFAIGSALYAGGAE